MRAASHSAGGTPRSSGHAAPLRASPSFGLPNAPLSSVASVQALASDTRDVAPLGLTKLLSRDSAFWAGLSCADGLNGDVASAGLKPAAASPSAWAPVTAPTASEAVALLHGSRWSGMCSGSDAGCIDARGERGRLIGAAARGEVTSEAAVCCQSGAAEDKDVKGAA